MSLLPVFAAPPEIAARYEAQAAKQMLKFTGRKPVNKGEYSKRILKVLYNRRLTVSEVAHRVGIELQQARHALHNLANQGKVEFIPSPNNRHAGVWRRPTADHIQKRIDAQADRAASAKKRLKETLSTDRGYSTVDLSELLGYSDTWVRANMTELCKQGFARKKRKSTGHVTWWKVEE